MNQNPVSPAGPIQGGYVKHETATPFTKEESIVNDALAASYAYTSDQIRAKRPPLPQVELFRPRYGYSRRAFGLEDVIGLGRSMPDRRMDYSGSYGTYSGTSRPGIGML